jgi:hypothetical protein
VQGFKQHPDNKKTYGDDAQETLGSFHRGKLHFLLRIFNRALAECTIVESVQLSIYLYA